jgi:hypothetical protein
MPVVCNRVGTSFRLCKVGQAFSLPTRAKLVPSSLHGAGFSDTTAPVACSVPVQVTAAAAPVCAEAMV